MTPWRSALAALVGGLFSLFLTSCQGLMSLAGSMPHPAARSDVLVQKDRNGDWTLLVDGEPYVIQGVTYVVSKTGQSPDEGFRWVDWAYHDENHNGLADGPYDAWVDANRNGRQDDEETAVGDFRLMQEMGVNTIRWYHNASPNWLPNKQILRDLYMSYGIRVAVGDLFGAEGIGSGAAGHEGTDYRNPLHRQQMLESIKKMVREHRDEPYLLMWLLGNENNWYQSRTNAAMYPEVYAKFVNDAVQLIHQLDGRHPVALVNGDMGFLDEYARWTPDLDIFGANAYRGPEGFGALWDGVRRIYDRPAVITAYGGSEAPGYNEEAQVVYHRGCWLDILKNRAGGLGAGNSLGGFAFEWLDRWWPAGDPYRQAPIGLMGQRGDREVSWQEEYTGICGQGNGRLSPFLRQLRPVYRAYQQELWGRPSPLEALERSSVIRR